uniref:Uncharacterized protein n=1 Tax=Seriola lalandi dorsalis TaxID=1841481 RepID=A0A3B4WSE6_SERLL
MATRVIHDSRLTYYGGRCRTFCRITMALKETAGLYETLKAEWNKKNPNLSRCGELLTKLKVSLLELNFLPTTGSALTKQQLILARKYRCQIKTGNIHINRIRQSRRTEDIIS